VPSSYITGRESSLDRPIAGMPSAEPVHPSSEDSRDETIGVPRELIETFLVRMESQADCTLTSRQRETLELLAMAPMCREGIVVSRELFEALLEVAEQSRSA
jgi:hypothetical protein